MDLQEARTLYRARLHHAQAFLFIVILIIYYLIMTTLRLGWTQLSWIEIRNNRVGLTRSGLLIQVGLVDGPGRVMCNFDVSELSWILFWIWTEIRDVNGNLKTPTNGIDLITTRKPRMGQPDSSIHS